MKKMALSCFIALFVCPVLLSAQTQTLPTITPTKAIQDLDVKLDTYKTGANITKEDEEFNRNLKKEILHGTFDVKELSRISLGKHWLPLIYKQRADFIDLMTELLENRAILSKEQGQKKTKAAKVYAVKYTGDKYLNKDKTRVVTKTKVFVKSEDLTVELDYKLRAAGTEWKIYDVIMDKASLADNYKYQFDQIITKHDYNELVRRMKKKLQEIKDEDAKDTGEDKL